MKNTPFDLTGKVAVVTGSSRGIGRASAELLAKLGAKVVISSRKADACEEVADGIKKAGGDAHVIACNISRREEIEALISGTTKHYGKIDILVCNAASNPYYGPMSGISDEQFRKILDNNVIANNWLIQMAAPGMIERKWGRVVLVGSLAGKTGGLIAGAHYAASKGGLHALVKWLAQRAAPHNVLVNGVAPASTATPMMEGRPVDLERIPLRRMSQPEEVAWPIAFLCSEAASYICGTVLDINGGVHMS